MRRPCLVAMSPADDADNGKTAVLGALGHLDDHLADAAGRDDDHHIAGTKGEVAEDLLGIAGRLLQVEALPQAVGTDNQVVEGQPQFDDGVPADKAALSWRHLLAEHAAVSAA